MAIESWYNGDQMLEDGTMATRQQWSNATAIDGMKVMEVITTATRWTACWQHYGNGRAMVMSVVMALATAMDDLLLAMRL
jgi:hypothetical protein